MGESAWLYPQTDVFIDLANARDRDGGDVRFGVSGTRVLDAASDRPVITYADAGGTGHEVRCDYLVGADGSRSICRFEIPESLRTHYFREYPFAWFGILAEAPKSAPELVYTHSPRGFALISQRTETLQRMYFQCDPDEDTNAWSDDRIWAELQARVAGPDGFTLPEGPITDRAILRFRSFVAEPMRYGRLLLAGDAAHTVPPTGAKGLNLALADVRVLAEVLERAVRSKRRRRAGGVQPASAGPGLEGAALLVLDDDHAAHAARHHRLRPTSSARRTGVRDQLGGRVGLSRRGLHRLASVTAPS